jgi:photosystem II stability/assembly factor-like uncharacterized protein
MALSLQGNTRLYFASALLAAAALAGSVLAAPAAEPRAAATTDDGDHLIQDLRWRNIGNANLKGRISSIDALEGEFSTVIVGTASGGVWKSTNAGTTWTPIFDNYGAASIGEVRISQNDPDVIWVGTGEEDGRNSATWGDGVYKSTDGGETFMKVLDDTWTVGDIVIHPDDDDIVIVAVLGNIWDDLGIRGLFKTTDGGATWTKLTDGLPDAPFSGALRLRMHPEDPDTMWVTFWERRRWPWRFESGGDHGGIFKTTDGGDSWRKLIRGLPDGPSGKIGLDVSRSNPDVLVAHYEHGFQPQPTLPPAEVGGERRPNADFEDMSLLGSGIYRSEDGGETWTYVNRFFNRPFYYNHVWISPDDDELIYSLTSRFQVSRDGGHTLERMPSAGHCFHAMWIDPHNAKRFWQGNDGGLYLSFDRGENSLTFKNMNVTQYYAVGADMRDPYWVCGGLQDAGTSCGPSMTRADAIYTSDWRSVGGGDGFHAQIDPTDWRTVYSESQGGNVRRYDLLTGEGVGIQPTADNVVNYTDYITPEIEESMRQRNWRGPFRFNWSTPIIMSPHNPRTILLGGNHVFKTVDRGETWHIISPDLTDNDPEKTRRDSGGLTQDNTGAEHYATIITISQSALDRDVIWSGTDDGNIHVTRDGGVTWTRVDENISGLPMPDLWVSRVEASHADLGTAYVSIDAHRSANFEPWVFKTTDFGSTWTSISNNLPADEPVYVIKEDPENPDLLYVGTEFSIYYSSDGGESWKPLRRNLPTVAVHDILVHPRDGDLIIATHGRGLWIMDDIWVLQQASEEVRGSGAHLLTNPVATQWLRIQPQGTGGSLGFAGENPSRSARIGYFLAATATGEIRFEISNVTGTRSRTYTVEARPGIGLLDWDMRYDPTDEQVEQFEERMERLRSRGQTPTGDEEPQGDRVAPGDYRITMTIGDLDFIGSITVREDPMLQGAR